jgi:hypothetical protein
MLRDGASAIYGADAAAGVINSIISPNTGGGRIGFDTALTQHGGAEEYRITAADTFKFGRTSIGVSLDCSSATTCCSPIANGAASQTFAARASCPRRGTACPSPIRRPATPSRWTTTSITPARSTITASIAADRSSRTI